MIIRIASSTQFLEQLVHVRTALEKRGHSVILPKKEEKEAVTKEQKRQQLAKLQKELEDIDCLLVMNYTLDGKKYAIPAVVMAQIGVALYFSKAVYIYDDFPVEYRQELEQLGVVALHGDLLKHF